MTDVSADCDIEF